MKKKTNKQQITLLGEALRTLGGLGGSTLGNFVGQADTGKSVGRSFGGAVSRWLGSGDYAVSSNSLVSPSGTVPNMHREGQTVVVRHKEFVGTVLSSAAFNVQMSLSLNPGLETPFPWLSRLAASFQEYRIRGMVFHYIPSSGDAVASTNPALGTVMFQTSYRATDSAPSSKIEILNEYWSSENVPSEPFCHPIECDPKENPFNVQYVRTGDVPSGDSKLMYDLGTTHVAVMGMQTTGNPVGDLWVTYEVELKKPIISSNATAMSNYYGNTITSGGSFTTSNFWAGTQVLQPSSNLDITLASTGRTVTFPTGITGRYRVVVIYRAVTVFTEYVLNVANTFTNCVQLTNPLGGIFGASTYSYGTNVTNGGDAHWIFDIEIKDPHLQASLVFGVPSLVGVVASVLLTISQLP
jgi:hypothetical protein